MAIEHILQQLAEQNAALVEQNAAILSRLDQLERKVDGDTVTETDDIEQELDTAELLGWRIDDYLEWRAEHGKPSVVPRPAVAASRG